MKKAIIFDCDNTLWEGVVGEGEVSPDESIISDLVLYAKKGVIIGICSKNNESDVLPKLEEYGIGEFISTSRINWKDKASNLKEIIHELNIGADAVVFVDDSEFEVELIRKELPEVLAIYPHELTRTVNEHFWLNGDISKTRQYQENYKRAKYAEEFTDIENYLASLDMVLKVRLNDRDNIPRIAEMTQKTNQFNLTTHRLTESEVKNYMEWCKIFTLSVSDKFGDNGITGMAMIRGSRIELFLLSCRILGRNIEFAFMDYVLKYLKEDGYDGLIGTYIMTPKNVQVSDFYPKCGFKYVTTHNEIQTFSILLSEYESKAPKYFRYE